MPRYLAIDTAVDGNWVAANRAIGCVRAARMLGRKTRMQRVRFAAVAVVMLAAGVLLAGCPTPNGYRVARVLPRLDAGEMTAAVAEPGAGNNVLVLTKPGVILHANLDDANAAPATFMDISDRIIQNPGQEE